MSTLAELVAEVTQRLGQSGVRHALVGGLAVSALTEPRFTRDVDLVVAARDDSESEGIISALVPPFRVLELLEHESLGRLAAVRLGKEPADTSSPVLDLLFASSGIEDEVVSQATVLELFPGVEIPVARTGHLIALKLLSRNRRRPQDEGDLRLLLSACDAWEIQLAMEAAALIMERGAHRDRNLVEDLASLLAAGAEGVPSEGDGL